jgi:hypothetical protein
MTSDPDTLEMVPGVGRSGASVGETFRSSEIDHPPVDLPAQERHEINRLALRMHGHHPHLSLATVTALVEQAYAELAGARVQSFRMILTERAVRRRLVSSTRRA